MQERRGSELSLHLFSEKMIFTSKQNIEMRKREKVLKKTTTTKFSGIFFYITSSMKGRGLWLS